MKPPKKPSPSQNGPYKLAAAERRAKFSLASSLADAVSPSEGHIRIALSGKTISRAGRTTLFGRSSIDIPEFSTVRSKKSA
jgi:hypothetical protein